MAKNDFATVRLLGNLSKLPDGNSLADLKIRVPDRLGGIVQDLQDRYRIELRRDSILMMVNGVEANALNDLETIIQPNDVVVLVPMFHGGS
jgi:molybdopterin converting factor small subunit